MASNLFCLNRRCHRKSNNRLIRSTQFTFYCKVNELDRFLLPWRTFTHRKNILGKISHKISHVFFVWATWRDGGRPTTSNGTPKLISSTFIRSSFECKCVSSRRTRKCSHSREKFSFRFEKENFPQFLSPIDAVTWLANAIERNGYSGRHFFHLSLSVNVSSIGGGLETSATAVAFPTWMN